MAEATITWISGPVLRASGVGHDLRRDEPYLKYTEVEFDVPVGEYGDVLDRYRVRLQEIREVRLGRRTHGAHLQPIQARLAHLEAVDAGPPPEEEADQEPGPILRLR